MRITRGQFTYTYFSDDTGQEMTLAVEFTVEAGQPQRWGKTAEDGYPGYGPEVEFTAARCVKLAEEDERGYREWQPGDSESRSIGAWFLGQIESDDSLRRELEGLACAEVTVDRPEAA